MHDNKPISNKRRWLIFFSVFSVGVFSGFNMFKAPPLFVQLMPELGFSESNIGLVMSVFTVIGIVLAFPAGAILKKLGSKTSLLITIASAAIGAFCGAFAVNATMLLVTRMVEGIAVGLATVVGSSAVAGIIPKRQLGLAMGIWTAWFPLSIALASNVSPAIASLGSWRTTWLVGSALAVCAFLFVLLVYKQVLLEEDAQPVLAQDSVSLQKEWQASFGTGQAIAAAAQPATTGLKPRYREIFLVTIAWGLWNIYLGGAIPSFYPTFLHLVHGMDLQFAGTASSVTNIIILFLAPIAGIVSDKLKTRKRIIVYAFCGASTVLGLAFTSNIALVWFYLIAAGVFAAPAAGATFASVSQFAQDPAKVGQCMAILAFFQNTGNAIGSAVFGPVSKAMGWHPASLVILVPAAIIGLTLVLLVREKSNKTT